MKNSEHDGTFGAIPVSSTRAGDASIIVNLIRTDGKVTGYVLSNGLKVTKEQGIKMVKEGRIKAVELPM